MILSSCPAARSRGRLEQPHCRRSMKHGCPAEARAQHGSVPCLAGCCIVSLSYTPDRQRCSTRILPIPLLGPPCKRDAALPQPHRRLLHDERSFTKAVGVSLVPNPALVVTSPGPPLLQKLRILDQASPTCTAISPRSKTCHQSAIVAHVPSSVDGRVMLAMIDAALHVTDPSTPHPHAHVTLLTAPCGGGKASVARGENHHGKRCPFPAAPGRALLWVQTYTTHGL